MGVWELVGRGHCNDSQSRFAIYNIYLFITLYSFLCSIISDAFSSTGMGRKAEKAAKGSRRLGGSRELWWSMRLGV